MYNLPATEITREIFFNMGGPGGFIRWFIYLPAFVVFAATIWKFVGRTKVWRLGQKENRSDKPLDRIKGIFTNIFAQTKILRQTYGGLMHASLLWGFAVLFIGTLIILVQEDITIPIFGNSGNFLYGNFYLWFSLLLDFFGMVAIVGTLLAIGRRYIQKPSQLDNKLTDLYALLLILLILFTGFLSEGLRIAITHFPPFEIWSPIGWLIAGAFAKVNTITLETVHKVNWWIHFALAMLFIFSLASGKLLHVLTSSANVYFRKLGPKGELQAIPPASFETAESFGVSKIENFTWKQLLDSDACTRCGRCETACPAKSTDKPLNPKKIIQDTKDNLDENADKIRTNDDTNRRPLIGESIKADELWACTNCAACQEECPVLIEHIQKITDMRRHLVLMEGNIDEAVQNTLRNMETNGNPYGIGFSTRGDWAKESGVKTLAEDPNVDYLYYVGCAGSFDDRNKSVAKALITLLQKAGLKVGILGEEETCCGDSALRIGNEYLFQMLATQNIETFKKYNVKKIITTCPHGYNIFKKEYKQLGGNFEVYHHSEILHSLIKDGKLQIDQTNKEENIKVTYHDSCFLGRYNGLYSEPRELISSLPNTDFKELSQHGSRSFCCGGGGGRMWMEETLGTRINHKRFEDIEASGSSTVCTACPFCLTMFVDATKDKEVEDKYVVKDIAEILLENIKN